MRPDLHRMPTRPHHFTLFVLVLAALACLMAAASASAHPGKKRSPGHGAPSHHHHPGHPSHPGHPGHPGHPTPPAAESLDLESATTAEIVADFNGGKLSCTALIKGELERIAAYDQSGPALNAIVTVNPHAMADAAALDARRAHGGQLGSAACVPVVVKDNIETEEVRTTFGSPLFSDYLPAHDAPIVAQMRRQGAIVLAKGNLDDFAASVFGYSTIAGFIKNPYDTTRTVGGSSGGPAASVAAGYAPLAIGTDTGGSLRIPAAFDSDVAIRPTMGLVDQTGMSPRALTQDTAGPIARTVADAAAGLELIADRATNHGHIPPQGYAAFASARSLKGVKIGVIKEGIPLWGGIEPGVASLEESAIAELESLGAEVVDVPQAKVNELDEGFACNDCLLDSGVITYESRRDLTHFLETLEPAAPVTSFDQLYDEGKNEGRYSIYAKEAFDREATIDLTEPEDKAEYETLLNRQDELREFTLALMADEGYAAVMYPSATWFPDKIEVEQSGVFTRWSEQTGFPAIGVPMGYGIPVEDPGEKPVPASFELLGRPYDEPDLIKIAAAYEHGADLHQAPPTTPTTSVPLGRSPYGGGPGSWGPGHH
jgi:Asp-tRNA(Asn)/Glu-tRNA(Gln) amidotransferase A subunit family amidase